MSGEFGGFGFAVGVVRGTRSFAVDSLGRLTGVSFRQVWTPGENHAQCLKAEDYYGLRVSGLRTLMASQYVASGGVVSSPRRGWLDQILGVDATIPAAIEQAKRVAEEKQREQERLEAERVAADTLDHCSHGFLRLLRRVERLLRVRPVSGA